MAEIDQLNVVELADKIKSGQLTCVQVVSKFIENIEKNRDLNALIYFNKEEILKEAKALDGQKENRGRLHGVPVVIKDNIHVKGIPNTAGCPGLKEFIPKEDAPIVRALRNEGALIMAKANMHELAYGSTSNNVYYGAVKNPHGSSRDYIAGGSSGGSGAAVAARLAPAALGTDTSGSVRMPASMNGIAGLKPTTGRYVLDGVVPLSWTCDTVGPMANCVDDLKLIDQILRVSSNESKFDKNIQLRIGIPINFLCSNLDPEVQEVFEKTKLCLALNDIELVPLDLTVLEALDSQLSFKLIVYETRLALIKYLHDFKINLSLSDLIASIQSPDVKSYFDEYVADNAPKAVTIVEYEALLGFRQKLINEYKRLFDQNQIHAIAYPTLSCLPIRFDEILEPDMDNECTRNSLPSSNAGLPSLCIPMGRSRLLGLPIGLQLDCRWHEDEFLLDLGSFIHTLIFNR